eukprot:TRINITY_DN1989_c0_g1_i1.p1 TRINITY_DN1989_c0_g1~~TRINITY_DN1989_c0_g1_i1.p1  ORF type:complete len:285 (+),score=63.22 TRINITY_DN1989_c0_g1_i1:90-944(+)
MADDEGNATAGLYVDKAGPSSSSQSNLNNEVRERSANLFNDAKMIELNHYTRSHQHEHRLRAAAELEERVAKAQGLKHSPPPVDLGSAGLRTSGCEKINQLVGKVMTDPAGGSLPRVGSETMLPQGFGGDSPQGSPKNPRAIPDEVAVQRMSRFETRLKWREEMDHSLRRLMQDMELAKDDRQKEYTHQAQCGHLDKIYDWYVLHGKKEARKERPAPPYVRFSRDGPVMPGSMRVSMKSLIAEKERQGKKKDDLGHSSSSPALMAAGALLQEPGTPNAIPGEGL